VSFFEKLYTITDPTGKTSDKVLAYINENFKILEMTLRGKLHGNNIQDGSLDDLKIISADSWNSAYLGTVQYRTEGVPTNNPVPSGIDQEMTQNGTLDIKLLWDTYTQGDKKADLILLFWKKGESSGLGAPTINDNCIAFNVNTTGASYYTLEGVAPEKYYSFGIAAARRTENGLEIGDIQSPTSTPDWQDVTQGTPDYVGTIDGTTATVVKNNAVNAWGKFSGADNTLPSGNVEFNYADSTSKGGNAINTDAVGTQDATAVQNATINFNDRNDRKNTIPANPTIASDGSAIDHTTNTDGSVNISFEWGFSGSGDAYDIDGFIVYIHQSSSSSSYTFGTSEQEEQVYYVTSSKRAFILKGIPADKYYTFGIQAYRIVDQDIDSSGVLSSSIIQPSLSTENPYRPSATVAFAGDVTGTVDGTNASTVVANASNGATAYSETVNYRTTGAPTNNPTPTAIDVDTNKDGSIDIKLSWGTYTQGDKKADMLMLFWKKGASSGLGAPTVNDSCISFNVNTASSSFYIFEGLASEKYYSFGIASARRTENGLEIGAIQSPTSSPNWQDVTEGSPDYKGNIHDDGTIYSKTGAWLGRGEIESYDIIDSPGTNPRGLAWDGEYLWHADDSTDKIYKLNTSGTVISSFSSPGDNPQGLTWDGEYLWHAVLSTDKIYKLNTSGTVISSFSSPGTSPRGLTWDGEYLWHADDSTDKIYKLNTSGTVISSFSSPNTYPIGLTWDGEYLWNVDGDTDKIYKLNTSGTVILSFSSPGTYPVGLTWDGEYLWNSDFNAQKIYKFIAYSYRLVAQT